MTSAKMRESLLESIDRLITGYPDFRKKKFFLQKNVVVNERISSEWNHSITFQI